VKKERKKAEVPLFCALFVALICAEGEERKRVESLSEEEDEEEELARRRRRG
jgi:hypothetical protein